jgi:hypothetical protein
MRHQRLLPLSLILNRLHTAHDRLFLQRLSTNKLRKQELHWQQLVCSGRLVCDAVSKSPERDAQWTSGVLKSLRPIIPHTNLLQSTTFEELLLQVGNGFRELGWLLGDKYLQ